MDAVVGMEGNGPASPDLREIGLILAADNAVALDGVVARMMGLDPGRLRFLQKAKVMGLGDFDSQMIKIDGVRHRFSDASETLFFERIYAAPDLTPQKRVRLNG